ncbi:MAG: type 4a pilus biogenesis protein PilO [Candidatus Omnitrophica bacterium]|nr:type 4a pilus biogenesis protein PilO [Candidatus Omnitrophota bacterium]
MKGLNLKAAYAVFSHLSKREKLILYVAAAFFSLMLLDRMIIFPISHKMMQLDKEIREKKSGIGKNIRILAQKDRILAEREKLTPLLGNLGNPEEELTPLLQEIETMANKSSVYLVDMKPAGIKSSGPYRKFVINLSCEAQMEQLIQFMYDIENSSKLLSIDKYQIGPKSEESSIAKCSMTISKAIMQ